MNADALKSWNEAQKRLWESLSTSLPAFHPPEGMEVWRETYLHNLAAWESAVKETLDMQAQWIRQWAERVGGEQNTPEAVAEWTRQVEEVMQHWVQTQNQLWDNWFRMLRSGGAQPAVSQPKAERANPPAAHPRPVPREPEPAPPSKPAAAKPPKPAAQAPEPPKAPAAAPTPKPKAPRKSAPRKSGAAKSKAAAQEPPAKAEPAKTRPEADQPQTPAAGQAEKKE